MPAALHLATPARAQQGGATALDVQTVPVLEGVRFEVGGRTFRTDARGRAVVVGPAPRLAERVEIPDTEIAPGVQARFSRRKEGKYLFDLLYRVRMSFRDLAGRPVAAGRVTSVTLKGSHGVRETLKSQGSQWLQGARVVPSEEGYRRKRLTWVVERAIVDGTNVVNRNQQSFVPAVARKMRVELLFYPAHVSARDALFKFPLGSHVRIEYPNGRVERHPLDQDAEVTLPALPRGDYMVSVEGPGISFERPLALSREQTVELEVLSYLDVGISFGLFVSVALGLLLVGRPYLARAPRRVGADLAHMVAHRVRVVRRPTSDRARPSQSPRPDARPPKGGRRLGAGRSRPAKRGPKVRHRLGPGRSLRDATPPKADRRQRRDRVSGRQYLRGSAPSWRDSVPRAAIAALAFGLLVVLLFGRDASVGALLGVSMFLLYLPLSYGMDRAVYASRSRPPEKATQASGRRRQDRLGRSRTGRGR